MKFRRHALATVLCAGALTTLPLPPAAATYVVTPFDVAGSSYTDVWDISDTGQLVGTAFTDHQFGYVYGSGSLLQLNGPSGSAYSNALGISETGVVVGSWGDSNSPDTAPTGHGFVWQAGTYTTINVPFSGATDTSLRAISPDGRYVAGTYSSPDGSLRSFILDRSTNSYTPVGQGTFDIAQGINSAGQMVGSVNGGSTRQSFIYDIGSGSTSYFSFADARSVSARAINDHGQISGWLLTGASGSGHYVAWIGSSSGYQTIAVGAAGATSTIGEGMNNLGQVAGFWSDATGNSHGFVATPAVDPVDTSVGGVYTFSTAVVADVPIFIDPLVAVGYRYRIGSGNPLFKTVSLPLGIGDNRFVITVNAMSFDVAGDEIFDFTMHGFAAGVSDFTVTGIEPQSQLDPLSPTAFVTRLSFAGDGMFTGSQTALTADYTPAVPEPGRPALTLAGLAALALVARFSKHTRTHG